MPTRLQSVVVFHLFVLSFLTLLLFAIGHRTAASTASLGTSSQLQLIPLQVTSGMAVASKSSGSHVWMKRRWSL